MADANNPHDAQFKAVVSDEDNVRSLMQMILPGEILANVDLSGIEVLPGEIASTDLASSFTDLLVRAPYGEGSLNVLYLYEHKSYEDKDVSIQLYRYMGNVWQRDSRCGVPCWPFVCVVVYHGEKEWSAGTELRERIPVPDEVIPYFPNFRFELFEASKVDMGKVVGKPSFRIMIYLWSQRSATDRKSVIRSAFEILAGGCSPLEMQLHINYIVQVEDVEPDDVVKLARESKLERGVEVVMSTYEKIRQAAKEEGLEEGREEGREEGLAEGFERGLVLAVEVRFGKEGLDSIASIRESRNISVLGKVQDALRKAKDIAEFRTLLGSIR
ncbi:MAG: Rpn family recombination-promoting nuclease/putative transposase [Planctomycetes bacterium]|nr:Rpn family recombination-promoting nuclease/putative transposase [Planctomycetota bacterium]